MEIATFDECSNSVLTEDAIAKLAFFDLAIDGSNFSPSTQSVGSLLEDLVVSQKASVATLLVGLLPWKRKARST